ncbi:beta-N-acetylhexosaminidase [Acidithiobacillus sp. AMEEHan]|uniref:beta-N-acetylhexosaminidase n=1 Tax=Acidithiobacillus sp. AMEEHan TaxID=2994951 RepID=UPI0027E3C1BF|nr:beta-N-acetylhexosaminidase [Acidithiobacillus sp. AMEEHan]
MPNPVELPLGPLMIDISDPTLGAEDRERLLHPTVGGVILFARNCVSHGQVQELCGEIHALRQPALLIAIDQEGGRVQRLRDGVTRFPPQASLGRVADREGLDRARTLAEIWGELLGYELRQLGIDMDFTPCIDLASGVSAVIGDRALHSDPRIVGELASHLWQGMDRQGLTGVAKHFPGHGGVAADSHHELPIDPRPREALATDLRPFRRLVAAGIPAVMPAHVKYSAVDEAPAGYSPYWLRQVLRGELGFTGVIVSDDLSMAGALGVGAISERVDTALAAGCEMLLICNDAAAANQAMQHCLTRNLPASRFGSLRGQEGQLDANRCAAYRDEIDKLREHFSNPL